MLFHSKSSKSKRSTWLTVGMAGSAASLLCFSQVALAAGFKSSPSHADPIVDLLQDSEAPVQSSAKHEDKIDVEVRKLVELAESGKLGDKEINDHVQNILRLALAEEELGAQTKEEIINLGGEMAETIYESVIHGQEAVEAMEGFQLDLNLDGLLKEVTGDIQLDGLLEGFMEGHGAQAHMPKFEVLLGQGGELAELSTILEKELGQELGELSKVLGRLPQMIEAKDWEGLSKLGAEVEMQAEGKWQDLGNLGEQIGRKVELRLQQAEAEGIFDFAEDFDFSNGHGVSVELEGLSHNLAGLKDRLKELGLSKHEGRRVVGENKKHAHELKVLKELLGSAEGSKGRTGNDLQELIQGAMKLQGVAKHLEHRAGHGATSHGKGHVVRIEGKEMVELLKLAESLSSNAQNIVKDVQVSLPGELTELLRVAESLGERKAKTVEDKVKVEYEQRAKRELEKDARAQEKRLHKLEAELNKRQAELRELERRIERERRRF